MTFTRWIAACVMLVALPSAFAQTTTAPAESPPASPPPTKTSYETGDWTSWQKMTGDWGGVRSQLADAGVTFDLDVTQILQGNAHGGANTTNAFRYSGSADLEIKLDLGKLGLIPGGHLTLLGEPIWGQGINEKVGSLLPVNFDAAKAGTTQGDFLFSEWFYTQVLAEGKVVLIAGKLFGARAFDRNEFANDERTQFMNVAFRNNVMIPAFLPYTTLGVGAIVNPTDWLSILTAVADTDGRVDTTGFDTAFHGATNTTVIHEMAFKIKPFDLPGTQRVGFAWSSKDFEKVKPPALFAATADPIFRMLGPKMAQNLVKTVADFDEAKDNIMIYYNFDQYLYVEPEDNTQGIGLFGRFGWARQDVNPPTHFYSLGMGGKGVIPTRDRDTCGIGYYFLDLSNDLPAFYHSEQGVECYYNIEIFPWLHVSPDIQIIMDPGGSDTWNDTALVYGMRMQVNL